MKRRAAHAMRRAAHALIAGSNRLDPPKPLAWPPESLAPGADSAAQLGAKFASRAIQYGQQAGMDYASGIVAGLAGARPALPNQAGQPLRGRSRVTRLMDWLDRTDYGFGLGLLVMLAAAVIALFGSPWWWISIPLTVAAFALCWWFG